MSATNTVDPLITSDQNKDALRTALGSPAKPKELTADILKTIEADAKGGSEGLKNRIAKAPPPLHLQPLHRVGPSPPPVHLA
jgi:hypothetical protein